MLARHRATVIACIAVASATAGGCGGQQSVERRDTTCDGKVVLANPKLVESSLLRPDNAANLTEDRDRTICPRSKVFDESQRRPRETKNDSRR